MIPPDLTTTTVKYKNNIYLPYLTSSTLLSQIIPIQHTFCVFSLERAGSNSVLSKTSLMGSEGGIGKYHIYLDIKVGRCDLLPYNTF